MTMEAHFEALRAARSHQVMATAEVGRLERELQAKVLAGETTGAQVMDFAIGHGCGFAFAMTIGMCAASAVLAMRRLRSADPAEIF